MLLFKRLALVGLAAVTLPVLHAKTHCPGNVDSLSLRVVQSSLIVVPVQINHSGPYDFVVDTGAQVSTVDRSLASELDLKPQGSTGVGGVATFDREAFAYLSLLEAGKRSVANSLVLIRDIAQLKAADPRIRGILGDNFLEHFDLLIDNRQGILCLDEKGTLASVVKGEHIALASPYGSKDDLPFTRPMIVAVSFAGSAATSILLRIDSGSNAPLLYSTRPHLLAASAAGVAPLRRVVNGTVQKFEVLPAQELWIGKHVIPNIPFVVPMNSVGDGPSAREDGLLPTTAFQRVFISSTGQYAVLETW
jgi:predicted aspartyl protease